MEKYDASLVNRRFLEPPEEPDPAEIQAMVNSVIEPKPVEVKLEKIIEGNLE